MSGKTMQARIAVYAAIIFGTCMTWSTAHAAAPLPSTKRQKVEANTAATEDAVQRAVRHRGIDAIDPSRTSANISCCSSEEVILPERYDTTAR